MLPPWTSDVQWPACPARESAQLAQAAIGRAFASSEQLVNAYIKQVFHFRHQRQAHLDTTLACALGSVVPTDSIAAALRETFNAVCLPMSWADVEPKESDYRWEPQDRLLEWAITAGLHVVGGPLIDFAPHNLPGWFIQREKNLAGIAGAMCNYANTVVKRYRGRIRTWQLTTGANASNLLGLGEEELLWLTMRVAETTRQFDANIEVVIGLSQPWGEYLAGQCAQPYSLCFRRHASSLWGQSRRPQPGNGHGRPPARQLLP